MKSYETVVVISAEGGETQIKDDLKKIEGILSGRGAKSVTVDRWGTKVLGYLMKGQNVGHYAAFRFECDDANVPSELSNILRITDTVLKFQTHALGLPARKFKGRVRPNAGGTEGEDLEEAELIS